MNLIFSQNRGNWNEKFVLHPPRSLKLCCRGAFSDNFLKIDVDSLHKNSKFKGKLKARDINSHYQYKVSPQVPAGPVPDFKGACTCTLL